MKRFASLLLLSFLAACGSDEDDKDRLPAPPSECESLPSLTRARDLLLAKMDDASAGAETIEPKSGFVGQVPLNIGYAVDRANQASGGASSAGKDPAPLLVRSQAEIDANDELKNSKDSFDVDWSKEVLLITTESAREAMYRYARAGNTLVAITAHARPCLAEADTSTFATPYPEIRVLRVPKEIESARVVSIEERYRMPAPHASGVCKRTGGTVASGATAPSIARGPSGIRLYFGGFSAMTGNVFFGESKDGEAFTPNGWDMGHLSKFDGRGPYADVYGASVEAVADGWRMTAHTVESKYVDNGEHHTLTKNDAILEMTSPDGIAWSKGTTLMASAPDSELPPATGPFRITVDGEERMYLARNGEIHVARRHGNAQFVEDAQPVLVPPKDLDAYDGLGYGDPEVARVGDRFFLFFTTSWGGLSAERPWRSGIGYAVSSDGVTFERADEPLVVPELEDEAYGLGAPSVLLDGGHVSVFFTAVNRNAEPVIKRVTCDLP